MEKDGNTHYWKSRWCEDTMFEYLKTEPPSFKDWWSHFDDDEPQEEKSLSPKEKLEQAEFVECEVVDDTPLGIAFAH